MKKCKRCEKMINLKDDFYFHCEHCGMTVCGDCGIDVDTECPGCGGEMTDENEKW